MGAAKRAMMEKLEQEFCQSMITEIVDHYFSGSNFTVDWSPWEMGFIEETLANDEQEEVEFETLSSIQQEKVQELYEKFEQSRDFFCAGKD